MQNRHTECVFDQVLQFLVGRIAPDRSVLVGVDGGAGSGKSTFSRWLAERLSAEFPASLVLTESFYRPSAERVNTRFPLAVVADVEWERLRMQVIAPLRSDRAARYQRYDWPADARLEWVTINVGGVTIIDGVTSTRSELSAYYDLRVWFACPREVRAARMLGRGDTSAEEVAHWQPSEEHYIATHAPEKAAHLVVDASAERAANMLCSWSVVRWSPPGAV